jgi:DNA repair protein RadA
MRNSPPREKREKALAIREESIMATKTVVKTIEDLPGVGPQALEKLMSAGYKSLEAIAVASPSELIEAAALGEITAAKVIGAARDALEMGYETATELAEKRKLVGRLPALKAAHSPFRATPITFTS